MSEVSIPGVRPFATSSDRSAHKDEVRRARDSSASERVKWLKRAAFFHAEDLRFLKFQIPDRLRILELGCGNGHLLAALNPSIGLGVDFSQALIDEARVTYPHLSFMVGDIDDDDFINSLPGPFDVILIADTLGELDDCQRLFESLHDHCSRDARLIIVYFSHMWYPALKLAELLRLRMPQPAQNVLAPADVRGIAELADFETVKTEIRMLTPIGLLGLGRLINRFVAPFPLIRNLCLRHYSVCRSLGQTDEVSSATVVIPVRNERGNIAAAVQRISRFVDDLEIIFVEGHSNDGTWEEIERVIANYPGRDIKAMRQPGRGKADAVFAGFDAARGDVLMILDGDLTVPPEQLSKFWQAILFRQG